MIIQRYVLRQVVQSFAALLGLLMLIVFSHRFMRHLAEAAAGIISREAIVQLVVFKLIGSLVVVIPLAFYLAILLAFSRLYKDSEIAAMNASGIGIGQLARVVFWLSSGFAAITAVLALQVAPQAASLAQDVRAKAREESAFSGVFPGRFREFDRGQLVVYAEEVALDSGVMRTVFTQARASQPLETIVAASAFPQRDEASGDRFIVLVDGHRYRGDPGTQEFLVTKFARQAVRVASGDRGAQARRLKALPTTALWNSPNLEYQAELQRRLSGPVSVILLALLAVPLSRTSSREGKYAKLFTAVLMFFFYNNLLSITQELLGRGDFPRWLGVWPVHGGLAVIAIVLLVAQIRGYRSLWVLLPRARLRT